MKKIEEIIIVFCIIAITLIINVNIVLRHVFNMSWSPTEEICLILVVVFTFIGSAYATRIGAHLFASFLFDIPAVSRRFKKKLAIVVSLVSCLTAGYVTYLGIYFVHTTYVSTRVTPVLGIPFYTFYMALPVGFALITWQSLRCMIKNIRSEDYYLGAECKPGGNENA